MDDDSHGLMRGSYARALLVAIGIPVLLSVAAKIHRVALHPRSPSLLTWPGLLGSDIAYQVGLAGLALALFQLCGERRRLGLALAQLPGLLSVLLTVVTHGYYTSTGQLLDYQMLAFALRRVDEVYRVAAAEVSAWLVVAAAVFPLALLGIPWWWVGRSGSAAARTVPVHRRFGRIAILGVVSALGFYLSQLPAVEGYRRAFVRAPMLQLFLGAVRRRGRDVELRDRSGAVRAVGATALRSRAATSPNVVIVILESIRAQSTTPYRHDLDTTPFLTKLAEQSLLVERAYAVVPHTSKALVAVLCGFEPRSSVEIVEASPGGMPGKCLARLLSEVGYTTAYFQAPTARFENREALTRNMGFEEFHSGDRLPHRGFHKVNYFGYEDDILLPATARFIDAQHGSDKPFFAAYLTNIGHSPYGVPPDFEVRTLSDSELRNRYYNAVVATDRFVEQLFAQYRDAGLLDDTIFVVVGDHGEGMYEHGARGHDTILYEEAVTVPLLLRLPGGRDARHVPGPISQLSIVPTLIDAAGFDVSAGGYEGRSFLEQDAEPVVYMACYHAQTCAAMVRGDRKLIHYYGDRDPELFDLRHDRRERHNLAGDDRGLVWRWTDDLLDWVAAVELAHVGVEGAALGAYVSDRPPTAIERPLQVRFGEFFEVLGYDPPEGKLRRRTRNRTRFYFRSLAPVPEGYRLRIRIHAPDGSSESVLDGVPVRGLYPLQRWKPGQYITDLRAYKLHPWDGERAAHCIELVDAQDKSVPATDASGRSETCYPLGVQDVRED